MSEPTSRYKKQLAAVSKLAVDPEAFWAAMDEHIRSVVAFKISVMVSAMLDQILSGTEEEEA